MTANVFLKPAPPGRVADMVAVIRKSYPIVVAPWADAYGEGQRGLSINFDADKVARALVEAGYIHRDDPARTAAECGYGPEEVARVIALSRDYSPDGVTSTVGRKVWEDYLSNADAIIGGG